MLMGVVLIAVIGGWKESGALDKKKKKKGFFGKYLNG